MTELMPYRPPAAQVAIPMANDTDSWTTVLNEVATLASQIANTPFVPDGLRGSAPAVAAAILSGRELGLGPMTSLANIHVIKGKPALSAALMRALILAQGHQIETVDISDTRAVVRGRRRGESEWEEATFTADQAKRAGIVLGGYPQDKLYARASSRLARRKFADVIAGMPYSAEELEDGEVVDTATGEVTTVSESKPRTAQRKQRTQNAAPAGEQVPPAQSPPATAATPSAEPAGAALPPLPGEEPEPSDVDHDTPGTAPTNMITAIWTSLNRNFEFGSDEKDQARMVCAHIVEHDLESTKQLSRNEAKTILDTLAHWQRQAEDKGEHPREYMIALMVAGDGEVRDGE